MARIPNGILGDFIGTAGNVSGYMRMDRNFIRTKRRRSEKPVSENKLAQQQKLKVCGAFTKPFSGSGFFDATFPGKTGSTATGYNKVTSALMKKAITGNYPDTALAWSQVLISSGGMPSPMDATASAGADSHIVFTWVNNAGTGSSKESDIAVLVAFCPVNNQAAFTISDSTRADGHAVFNAQALHGSTAQCWMGFISAEGKDAADSVYCGSVIV